MIEQLGKLGRAVDRVRRHAEQATERVNLFLRADADAVRRHERDVARAVTQHPTSSELRDQRGLADAGRADQRDDTAAFHPTLADRLDATRHQREREAMRFGQLHSLRQLTHQFAGEIVREAEHCQLLSSSVWIGARRDRSFHASVASCVSSMRRRVRSSSLTSAW